MHIFRSRIERMLKKSRKYSREKKRDAKKEFYELFRVIDFMGKCHQSWIELSIASLLLLQFFVCYQHSSTIDVFNGIVLWLIAYPHSLSLCCWIAIVARLMVQCAHKRKAICYLATNSDIVVHFACLLLSSFFSPPPLMAQFSMIKFHNKEHDINFHADKTYLQML